MSAINIFSDTTGFTIRVGTGSDFFAFNQLELGYNTEDTNQLHITNRESDGVFVRIDFSKDQAFVDLVEYTNAADFYAAALPVMFNDTGVAPTVPMFETLITGNWVGYSLMRLSAAATNCVRVRRASDDTEQDFGFVGSGANAEIDIAALETFCAGTDGFVHTWYDQGNTGNDALRISPIGNQPQIVSNGSVVLKNGKPVIDTELSANNQWFVLSSLFNAKEFYLTNSLENSSLEGGNNTASLAWSVTAQIGWVSNTTPATVRRWRNKADNVTYQTPLDIIPSNMDLCVSNTKTSYINSIENPYETSATSFIEASVSHILANSNGTQNFIGQVSEITITADEQTNRSDIENNINLRYSIY